MFDTETNYEVVVYTVGDTKAGTKMGKLQLKNPNDETLLNCILWEETLNRLDSKIFRTGNIVRIVSGSFNERYNNCLVSAIELIKEAKTGLSETEREEHFNSILEYANNFKNEKLRDFIVDYFMEHKTEIKLAPAAKKCHHNYIGGLLVHTLECLNFAKTNLPLLNGKINSDELYSACILHDIGKIFEYKIDSESGLIEHNEEFHKTWISHSQYGFSICMTNGFERVAKMIAAHHGRTDWGAIVDLNEKDLESYVYIMHHIDDLSAKFGKISVTELG